MWQWLQYISERKIKYTNLARYQKNLREFAFADVWSISV